MGILTTEHGSKYVWAIEIDAYDPVNRNRVRASDDPADSGFWGVFDVTVADSAKTDPEGLTNAHKLTAGNVASTDRLVHAVSRELGDLGGLVCRVAFLADTSSSPHNVVGIASALLTLTEAHIVEGPGTLTEITGGVDISNLSTTVWTVVELVWSLADNPGIGVGNVFNIYPGGKSQNAGAIHMWTLHIEDEVHPDGLGFRSRGQRRTVGATEFGDGAGADVLIRAATETYFTKASDTYPDTTGDLDHVQFPAGLILNGSVAVSGISSGEGGPLLSGVAGTSTPGISFANAGKERDLWYGLSTKDRAYRLYRGLPGAAFSTFDQVEHGACGAMQFNDSAIQLPITSQIATLDKVLDLPKFTGYQQCVRFAGDQGDEEILIGENPELRLIGDMTAEARVRMYSAQAGSVGAICSYGNPGSTASVNIAFDIYVDSLNEQIRVYQEHGTDVAEEIDSGNGTIPTADLTDGEWHHVAVARDGSAKVIHFYWDFELVASVAYTHAVTGGWDGEFRIGASATGERYFTGDIDEGRIWDTVRTAAEIRRLGSRPIAAIDHVNQGLRGIFHLDEGLGVYCWDGMSAIAAPARECYASFAGASGDEMTIPWNAKLEPSGDAWTFEVLGDFSEDGVTQYLMGMAACYRVNKRAADDDMRVQIYDSVGGAWRSGVAITAPPHAAGTDGFAWITGRWDGSTDTLSIFINGANKDDTVHAGSVINQPGVGSLVLGASEPSTNNSRVWVAEVRLWDAAESDADILERAAKDYQLTGNETNLKLWVNFNEAKKKEIPASITDQGTKDTDYAGTTIYDRQFVDGIKNDSSSKTGVTLITTTGEIQADARFVGTGTGDQSVEDKRKPYAVGEVYLAPLSLVDPLRNVYFIAIPPIEEILAVRDGSQELSFSELDPGDDDVWDTDFRQTPTKAYTRAGVGAWVDVTADVADDADHDGDVSVLHTSPASNNVDDGIYVAFGNPIAQMDVWMHQGIGNLSAKAGTDVEISIQFWNGEDWEDFRGLVDGTKGLRVGGGYFLSDDTITSKTRSVYTKFGADQLHKNGVANVRWAKPTTWIKESLNDIDTAMGVSGNPGDATDRWWLRIAATARPGGYDQEAKLSAIWVSDVDVVVDTNQGFIRFNAPPFSTPTVDFRGDNTGGFWTSDLPTVVQVTLDRWLPAQSFTYHADWATRGPDLIPSQLSAIGADITVKDFLAPVLAGMRSLLFSDRVGDLDITTIGSPANATVLANLTDNPAHLNRFKTDPVIPEPASILRYAYRPFFVELSDEDFVGRPPIVAVDKSNWSDLGNNLTLPASRRRDLMQPWRWIEETTGLETNPDGYLASEPVVIRAYVARPGIIDTLESEVAEWAGMLGARYRLLELDIPMGLIEHKLGYVVGLRLARLGLWHGVEADPLDGAAYYVLAHSDNYANELTTLLLWGGDPDA